MSTWVAALVAAAAITLTYLFCVRPMMRGRAADSPAEDPEIAQLREELRVLRAQHEQPPPTLVVVGVDDPPRHEMPWVGECFVDDSPRPVEGE